MNMQDPELHTLKNFNFVLGDGVVEKGSVGISLSGGEASRITIEAQWGDRLHKGRGIGLDAATVPTGGNLHLELTRCDNWTPEQQLRRARSIIDNVLDEINGTDTPQFEGDQDDAKSDDPRQPALEHDVDADADGTLPA